MHLISWICILALILTELCLSVLEAKGADQVRAQDLAGLSQEDRIAVMKSLLERRIDKLRNIEVDSETRIYNRKFINGKVIGDRFADGGWYEFKTHHCDGSYRVKSSWFTSQAATAADSTAISHYDERTGIVRIVAQQHNYRDHEGRIGLEHLPSMHSNRAALLILGISFVMQDNALDKCDFLLPSLAACSDQWQVDVNVQEQQVVISHPFRIAFVDTGTGTRKVYFDAVKGMLPVRVAIDWSGDLVTSVEPRRVTPAWREERIVMDEAKDFGGFWMPARIEERVRASSTSPDVCAIYLTKVKQFFFGRVKKEDLEVKFPRDTKVVDNVKNVFYRTGPDGEPSGPINPIGIPDGPITLDEHGQLVPKKNWMLHYGLLSIGCGIVLFLCLILVRKLRASSLH
jgi:hypothetical protein